MKKLLIFFFFLIVLTNACKKDETIPVKASENPVSSLISDVDCLKKKVASSAAIFPISRGSIIIEKSVYSISAVIIFPSVDYSASNAFYGFADITFIPN